VREALTQPLQFDFTLLKHEIVFRGLFHDSLLCHRELRGMLSSRPMPSPVAERLKELGIELPEPSKPGANYVPAVRTGNLVYLTGQLSQWNGERRFIGKLGREFGVDEGQQAARLCALNLVALLRAELDGDLDRVVRCVRIAGYVNSVPEFVAQSQVINGASDLFVEIFQDAGRHTRMAVGVSALPYGVAVEVEGLFEVR